jgi:hypothetical protein
MVKLNDLIRVYDNVLDSKTCNSIIDIYESNTDKHERIDNDFKPSFTQFDLTTHNSLYTEVHNKLIGSTFDYKDLYYEHVYSKVFPEKYAFEHFRIKKYNPGGQDRFDTHVDVQDYSSARRFLSFMWYLNDVDDGGQTVFSDLTITPKQGKLVIFPPLWMFPHRGEPPTKEPKYIVSTYLHYT